MPHFVSLFAKATAVLGLIALITAANAQESATELENSGWTKATTENTADAYQLFIFTYPDSDLASVAAERIATLRDQQNRLETEANIFDLIGSVTYDGPLEFGNEQIIGLTLEEIVESSPMFPPIEGLPEEVWANAQCSDCHQWTREALCDQASIYVTQDPTRYQERPHPFGGMLKINLRNWSMNDCR